MKAWTVHQWGTPEQMTYEEVDVSTSSEDKVRVQIIASGVNFFEGLLVAGKYQVRPELPFIPGIEGAGVVVSAPTNAAVRTGDRVAFFTEVGRGSYAEFADVDPMQVTLIPDAMSFAEGAALLTPFLTAHLGLHRRGRLQAGETLLVHAAAGGVGSAAVQLGKAAGARVIATAGSEAKVDFCRALGADLAVNYKEQSFVAAVKEFTEGNGADVVFDPVGGDIFDQSTKCIAFEGRIVVVGFTSGRIAEALTSHVLVKSYSVVGVHLNQHIQRELKLIRSLTSELLDLYTAGRIRPRISASYPIEEAPTALSAVFSGKTSGRVVLRAS